MLVVCVCVEIIIQLNIFFVFNFFQFIYITEHSIQTVAEKQLNDKHCKNQTRCISDNGFVLAKFKETAHQQWFDEFKVLFDRDCKQLSEVQIANMKHDTHKELAYLGFFFHRKKGLKYQNYI